MMRRDGFSWVDVVLYATAVALLYPLVTRLVESVLQALELR